MLRHFKTFIDYAEIIKMQANQPAFDRVQSNKMVRAYKSTKAKVKKIRRNK